MTPVIHGYDRLTGEPFASRSEVIGQNGMVATSHPLATQIGLDILKNGGNAIDAAIAANIALGLMEPTGNGIGGDLFAIVWSAKDKKLYGLNASGPAPQDISIDYIKSQGLKKSPLLGRCQSQFLELLMGGSSSTKDLAILILKIFLNRRLSMLRRVFQLQRQLLIILRDQNPDI